MAEKTTAGADQGDVAAEPRGAVLRVAGVDTERNFAGGETQVMGLTRELRRRGHRAELLCDPMGELWQRARAEEIPCHALPVRNAVDIAAGWRLRSLLARECFDVVHFHTARAHALAPYVPGRTLVRIVTRRMDYMPNRLFGRYLYNHAVDEVIAISVGVAEALERGGVIRERIHVIPSGVDCERFAPPGEDVRAAARARLGLAPEDIAIGAVGALVARKGHRVLLDAMALARGACDKATQAPGIAGRLRCFIAGAGPLESQLADTVRELALQREVRMMGALEDPRDLLAALDLFVMPSLHEGLGVAALEAMACGIPVIASRCGGLEEVVDDGRSGILVEAGAAAALARGITDLAQAPARRAAMSIAARQRAMAGFSSEVMSRRTLEVYLKSLHAAGKVMQR